LLWYCSKDYSQEVYPYHIPISSSYDLIWYVKGAHTPHKLYRLPTTNQHRPALQNEQPTQTMGRLSSVPAVILCLLIQSVASFSLGTISRRTSTSLYGIRSSLARARDSIFSAERSDADLKSGIAFFYDRSSKLWEDVWGEHMHHGYYVPEDRTVSFTSKPETEALSFE
jgi:cell division protein FtsL